MVLLGSLLADLLLQQRSANHDIQIQLRFFFLKLHQKLLPFNIWSLTVLLLQVTASEESEMSFSTGEEYEIPN